MSGPNSAEYDAHRMLGVGLCSCGSVYSLRWMTRDEWWAEHRIEPVDLGDDPDGDMDEIEAIAVARAAGHGYQPASVISPGADHEVYRCECETDAHEKPHTYVLPPAKTIPVSDSTPEAGMPP